MWIVVVTARSSGGPPHGLSVITNLARFKKQRDHTNFFGLPLCPIYYLQWRGRNIFAKFVLRQRPAMKEMVFGSTGTHCFLKTTGWRCRRKGSRTLPSSWRSNQPTAFFSFLPLLPFHLAAMVHGWSVPNPIHSLHLLTPMHTAKQCVGYPRLPPIAA